LGFSTRRLRHLQFQPHPGRHQSTRASQLIASTSRSLVSSRLAPPGKAGPLRL